MEDKQISVEIYKMSLLCQNARKSSKNANRFVTRSRASLKGLLVVRSGEIKYQNNLTVVKFNKAENPECVLK